MFHKAALSLGSNLGGREENLLKALFALRQVGEIRKASSLYETEPLGVQNQPKFLNAAVLLDTTLAPRALLGKLKAIEQELGRQAEALRGGPRVIDLDIVFFEGLILTEEDLTIPHPRMERRQFVLEPLAEIAPDWVHPVSGKSVAVLLRECPRQGCVRLKGFGDA